MDQKAENYSEEGDMQMRIIQAGALWPFQALQPALPSKAQSFSLPSATTTEDHL